ncbi:MAG: hypothetical protein IT431_06645 [Phycisphaerales bacterium]|nr:hypothetical protein [Phycisphaerales bacterium]
MQDGSGFSRSQVARLPLVIGALLMGVLLFGAVATMQTLNAPQTGGGGAAPSGVPGATSPDVLLFTLAVVTLSGITGYFVVGSVAVTQARRAWERRRDDEQGSLAIAQTLFVTTILRAALVESFGLFGGVLLLLQGAMLAWAPIGACIVLLASLMPAGSRLARLEEAATGVRGVGYGPQGQ